MPACVVCNKGAKSHCSRCKRVSYCSRECQAKHWKEGGHKNDCQQNHQQQPERLEQLLIAYSRERQCCVALENIKAGTVILKDVPLTHVSIQKQASNHGERWNFLSSLSRIEYLELQLEGNPIKGVDAAAGPMPGGVGNTPLAIQPELLAAPFTYTTRTDWKRVIDLLGHQVGDDGDDDDDDGPGHGSCNSPPSSRSQPAWWWWRHQLTALSQRLERRGSLPPGMSRADYATLVTLHARNSFQDCLPSPGNPVTQGVVAEGGILLYPRAWWLNHSCSPNAHWYLDPFDDTPGGGGRVMVIRALVDIDAGEEVTHSYLSSADIALPLPYRTRNLLLLEEPHCACRRCQAETQGSLVDSSSSSSSSSDRRQEQQFWEADARHALLQSLNASYKRHRLEAYHACERVRIHHVLSPHSPTLADLYDHVADALEQDGNTKDDKDDGGNAAAAAADDDDGDDDSIGGPEVDEPEIARILCSITGESQVTLQVQAARREAQQRRLWIYGNPQLVTQYHPDPNPPP